MENFLQDKVDRSLAEWGDQLADVDLTVEAIVQRIDSLARGLKKSMDVTLGEFGLNHGEWSVLCALRRAGPPYRRSPGYLAERAELSTGAMTNRIDRLETAGLVRRLPDPDDRRALKVELTELGHDIWRQSIVVQGGKEALLASALDPEEKEQLSLLLRRLMLAFETSSVPGAAAAAGKA